MTEYELFRLARERGITIERKGQAWKLTGHGVSILCADLRSIQKSDLSPPTSKTERKE